MNYLPLFMVDLTHDYYVTGRCSDFTIQPSDATGAILNNFRCVSKNSSSRLVVLAPLDNQSKPFIPIPIGTVFTFDLRLGNPDFPLLTDLPSIPSGAARVYTNVGSDGKWLSEGQSSLTSSPDRLKATIWAQIEIQYDGWPPQPADGPGELELHFTAKQARWEYYVVTNDGNNATEKFKILDKNSSDSPPMVFDQVATQTQPNSVWGRLAQQYPDAQGMQRIRFVSRDPVPCRQAARKGLQLWLGENKIFEHLPNPPPRNHAMTTVEIGGKSQQQESRFQIVKYITQPLSTMVG